MEAKKMKNLRWTSGLSIFLFTAISLFIGLALTKITSQAQEKSKVEENKVSFLKPNSFAEKTHFGFIAEQINGQVSNNPELIPDHVAYSLLFRFIGGIQDAGAKQRVRYYIRRVGLGNCHSCPGEGTPTNRGTEQDIDTFIAVADEFQQRVRSLDRQAFEIKKRFWTNLSPEVMAQLTLLQRQKETIVAEKIASLLQRLSSNGRNRVANFIKDELKKRIKINQRNAALNSSSSPKMNLKVNFSKIHSLEKTITPPIQPSNSSLTAGQTFEYSDHYMIDNHNGEQGYDEESGEATTAVVENDSAPQLVGLGVSEATYDSSVYSTETYTTITSPSGVTTVSGSSGGYVYARAEAVSIALNPDTAEDGDYQVSSEHRYYYELYEPPGACPPDAICPFVNNVSSSFQNLMFKNASYQQSFVKNAPATSSYYVSYSWWLPSVRRIYSGHKLLYGSNICRRAHRYFPYTSLKVCPDNASGCPLGFVLCTAWATNYSQCITLKVTWGGGYYSCIYPRCYGTGSYPLCRN